MSPLLRVTALLSLGWAVLLFGLPHHAETAGQPTSLVRALANGLGIANLVFSYIFWHAAREPAANRAAVYGAIMLLTLKTANDLYGLLVLLPADHALVSLADLVLSVGLLVGILEALPRMLTPARSPSRDPD